MTIESVTYESKLNAVEVLPEAGTPAATAGNRKITHNQFSKSMSIANVTKVSYGEHAMTAGGGSIDFTDLPGVNNASVDGTGLKVKSIRLEAPADNAGPITIEEGASDGLDIGMTAILAPGADVLLRGNDSTIGASTKILDLSGTGTDKVKVSIALGT